MLARLLARLRSALLTAAAMLVLAVGYAIALAAIALCGLLVLGAAAAD